MKIILLITRLSLQVLSTSNLRCSMESQHSDGLSDALEVIAKCLWMAIVLDIDCFTTRSLLNRIEDTLEDKLATTDAINLEMESDEYSSELNTDILPTLQSYGIRSLTVYLVTSGSIQDVRARRYASTLLFIRSTNEGIPIG